MEYSRLFLSERISRIRPKIKGKGSSRTLPMPLIYLTIRFRIFVLWKMYVQLLQRVKYSCLNSATFCLSNKSDDRIITLTREEIDLSLRVTELMSNEPFELAVLPNSAQFLLFVFIEGKRKIRLRSMYKYIHGNKEYFRQRVSYYVIIIIRLKQIDPIKLFYPRQNSFLIKKFDLRNEQEISYTYLRAISNFLDDFSSFSNTHVPFSLSPTTHCQRENKVGAIGRVITIRHGNIPSTTTHRKGSPQLYFSIEFD